jgi:hypothetical protein
MKLELKSHLPFAQLSIAERFLYFTGAVVAIGRRRPWSRTAAEIGEDLRRIWDDQKFTPADVVDFTRMADRLKPHLTKYAVKDPQAWTPASPSRMGRREIE